MTRYRAAHCALLYNPRPFTRTLPLAMTALRGVFSRASPSDERSQRITAQALTMNAADYVVIAGIGLSAVWGAVRGFLREAIALATWLVALFIAWHFSSVLEPHLGGLLADPSVRPWAARIIIVALILLLGMIIGVVVGHFVRRSMFDGTDRFLGFLFGAARGAVLLGVFVILGRLLHLDSQGWWRHSLLIPYGHSIANGLQVLVGAKRV